MKNMKKILTLIATVLTFFSCSKDSIRVEEEDENSVFYATFEGASATGSKVYSNDQLKLRWNADDRISLFDKNSRNKEYRERHKLGIGSGHHNLTLVRGHVARYGAVQHGHGYG